MNKTHLLAISLLALSASSASFAQTQGGASSGSSYATGQTGQTAPQDSTGIVPANSSVSAPISPASCGSVAVTWGSACSGTLTPTSSGSSVGVANSASGYSGSATYSCSNGAFAGPIGASCTANAAPTSPPATPAASTTLNETDGIAPDYTAPADSNLSVSFTNTIPPDWHGDRQNNFNAAAWVKYSHHALIYTSGSTLAQDIDMYDIITKYQVGNYDSNRGVTNYHFLYNGSEAVLSPSQTGTKTFSLPAGYRVVFQTQFTLCADAACSNPEAGPYGAQGGANINMLDGTNKYGQNFQVWNRSAWKATYVVSQSNATKAFTSTSCQNTPETWTYSGLSCADALPNSAPGTQYNNTSTPSPALQADKCSGANEIITTCVLQGSCQTDFSGSSPLSTWTNIVKTGTQKTIIFGCIN